MRIRRVAFAVFGSALLLLPSPSSGGPKGDGQGRAKARVEQREARGERVQRRAERQAERQSERRAQAQAQRQAERRAEGQAARQSERRAQAQGERRAQAQGERRAERQIERRAELRAERQAERRVERRAEGQAERRVERRAEARAQRAERRQVREPAFRDDDRMERLRADRRAQRHAERRVDRRAERLGGEARMRFRGLDRNGDGVVTRAEWRGNDRSFANHDWNGDGLLAGAEVSPGALRPRFEERGLFAWRDRDRLVRRDAGDRFGGRERIHWVTPDLRADELIVVSPRRVRTVQRLEPLFLVDSTPRGHLVVLPPPRLVTDIDRVFLTAAPQRVPLGGIGRDVVVLNLGLDFDDPLGLLALPLTLALTNALVDDVDMVVRTSRFAAYDRDFDGYLTATEYPLPRRTFRSYDRDGDLMLVEDELYADEGVLLVDRERLVLFHGLDRDDDGVIAPWEWPGSMDSFFLRDFDGDGAVSLDEFVGLVGVRPMRGVAFGDLDFDGNGDLVRVEWVGDPLGFDRLDRNRDGRVSRWEYTRGRLFRLV